MLEEKYIGLILAVTSTAAIGASFVITKKGLNHASERHGFEGEGFTYLKSPIWWAGIVTMVIGEIANFAAYAFAPAILVTPLGALSVLIGAVLGSYFLGEQLGTLGRIGCATCLIGAVIIVLHAPPDKDVDTINDILGYAVQPGFLFYCLVVIVFAVTMIYYVAPRHGRSNPLVFLSICSTVGSITICAVKGLGIALKLTLGGKNQFVYPSTYVFMVVTVVAIMTQMHYFNKALSQFSTNIVNPLYYVTFTTCTLTASFILFQGFNTTDAVNTISLLCGFLVIFTGVHLLNLSRDDPDGIKYMNVNCAAKDGADGIPTDAFASPLTRISMQARRSSEHRRGLSVDMDPLITVPGRTVHDDDAPYSSILDAYTPGSLRLPKSRIGTNGRDSLVSQSSNLSPRTQKFDHEGTDNSRDLLDADLERGSNYDRRQLKGPSDGRDDTELTDLMEYDEDEDDDGRTAVKRTSFDHDSQPSNARPT